jgi:SAM-dependent methyltransferase
MSDDSTQRFTDRVADYARYRPSYPPQVVDFMHQHGVAAGAAVADIGAGTGISTRLFLEAGHPVTAVEPNAAMRDAADRWLGALSGYRSVSGTAEATSLKDASVALVIAAQAFHWFNAASAKREFARILQPGGLVGLFSNSRLLDDSPFLSGYEALLQRYGVDYRVVAERYADDASMAAWFGTGQIASVRFPNAQQLDFDGVKGRLLSSSYAPKAGHPNHEPMLVALRALFDASQRDGAVVFEYETRVYLGRVS